MGKDGGPIVLGAKDGLSAFAESRKLLQAKMDKSDLNFFGYLGVLVAFNIAIAAAMLRLDDQLATLVVVPGVAALGFWLTGMCLLGIVKNASAYGRAVQEGLLLEERWKILAGDRRDPQPLAAAVGYYFRRYRTPSKGAASPFGAYRVAAAVAAAAMAFWALLIVVMLEYVGAETTWLGAGAALSVVVAIFVIFAGVLTRGARWADVLRHARSLFADEADDLERVEVHVRMDEPPEAGSARPAE